MLGVGSRHLAAAAALSAGLVIAACGNTAGSSSSSGPAQTAAYSSIQTQQHNESLRFARCMRSDGVPNFPDPPGNGSYGVKEFAQQASGKTMSIDGVPVNAPAFRSAMSKCSQDLPQRPVPTSAQLPKIRALMVRWAKCIRGHGVPGFGDPTITADGRRIIHGQFTIPALLTARKTCDPRLNRWMAAAGLGALAPS